MSCWGPLFSEPAAEGTELLHRAVGALVLRLAIQQRQSAMLIENEAPKNALPLLQVLRAQHRKPSHCRVWLHHCSSCASTRLLRSSSDTRLHEATAT